MRAFKAAVVVPVVLAGMASSVPAAESPANLRHTVVVDVVQKTKDAVVNISSTRMVQRRIAIDPFWQDFGRTVNVPQQSLGSGFIIHPDGYLLTNNHVIDRAREITAELADGRKLPATVIAADPDADLAVLRVKSDRPLPTLELGDSSDLMIGEPAIAVGNPLGFSHSVSVGIVAAHHRDLKDEEGKVLLSDLIQTDAAINPGNSGGPLLNAYGQVIGVNTAIRGDAQNIGFAVQVNKLRDLIPVLMNPATAAKIDVPVRLSERRKLSPPATVNAEVVTADGKVVRTIGGEPVRNIVDAYAALLKAKAGQKIEVVTDRGTESVAASAAPAPDVVVQARKKLGIGVEQMTPMTAAKMDMAWEDGILVTEVLRNGASGKAGIRPGDVIFRLGPYNVKTLDDFAVLLQHLPAGGRVRVGIVRENQMGYGMLQL